MPQRSVEEIEKELMEIGYTKEEISDGTCFKRLPSNLVSMEDLKKMCEGNVYDVYMYYCKCADELEKMRADESYTPTIPMLPDFAGTGMDDEYYRRTGKALFWQKPACDCTCHAVFFPDKLDYVYSMMSVIVARMKQCRNKEIVLDRTEFMGRVWMLAREKTEAEFETMRRNLQVHVQTKERAKQAVLGI